jgi:hypothetical protein
MMIKTGEIPVAHIDEAESVSAVLEILQGLHGPAYEFAVGEWNGATWLEPQAGHTVYRFLIEAGEATVTLREGDRVRGPSPKGPYRRLNGVLAEVTAPHLEALWPGDAICVEGHPSEAMKLAGRGVYFEISTEQTSYRAPRLALLRHLSDQPGGCAAYPGAFRRETLPPERPAPEAEDRRGANRVNEHTLDMRFDRKPPPIRHYHGPVPIGKDQIVNHSETAIVLPRPVYDLPEVAASGQGHVVIYRNPAGDPVDRVVIPVRPGSIVVTPATTEQVMGHCFENAFAMLIAIPGFVAPYHLIDKERGTITSL